MRLKLVGITFLFAVIPLAYSALRSSRWVSISTSDSRSLIYRTLPRGDRIVDFSYAGYMGGGVPLPRAPVLRTVSPSGKDDTVEIQRAIDEVSSMPLKNGIRGAIVLSQGTFLCGETIRITSSGVVLRGSGPLDGGTTLRLTGKPHVAISIAGTQNIENTGIITHIIQPYVPSSSQSIIVEDASAFNQGDTIQITRYATPQWLHFMGMDRLSRDGRHETWVGNSISTIRTVSEREGNVLTLDVPLTDSYDRRFLPPEGAEVTKISVSGRIEQDAVESLHILAPSRQVAMSDALFGAITLNGLRDGWIAEVLVDDTTTGIDAAANTARITMEDVVFRHTTTIASPAKPADFALRGTQLLVYRCGSSGNDLFYVITGARNQGPNVVLDSVFSGNGRIQPHQRWSTGFLVDNTRVPQGGIDLMNRGELGSGHGWTMGWGVIWNSSASSLIIQNPPGAANWSIGNFGSEQTAPMKIIGQRRRDAGPDLPKGIVESANHPVQPASLYRAQLVARLGTEALKALEF